MKKFRVDVTKDECKGCGRCVIACPGKVLEMGKHINALGWPYIHVANQEKCIGCGCCYLQCPEPGAITIYEITEDEK